jgi:patatin-like phospholipase
MPDYRAADMTVVMVEEFNQLHGQTFDANDPPTLKKLLEALHALPRGDRRAALCLSGGGIRSASFALGLVQALAERKILRHFHFLSTVSGGGYIGAWLTVWRHLVKDDSLFMKMLCGRRKKEKARLIAEASRLAAPAPGYHADQAYEEPMELSMLRANSSFLTPKLGVMSADTWTLVALYIRNLVLNWAVYVPLIFAVLLAPIVSRDVLKAVQSRELIEFNHFVLAAIILLFIIAVFTSVRGRLAETNDNRVTQGQFLIFELLPIYVASMLVCVYTVGQCNLVGGSGCWLDKVDPGVTAIVGGIIYFVAWGAAFLAYGSHPMFLRFPKPGDPWPPVLMWLAWTACGAISGGLVGWGMVLARPLAPNPTLIVVFGVGWIGQSIFFANAVYLAVTSVSRLGDVEREWLARSSGWFVAMTVVWAGFSALVLYAQPIVDALTAGAVVAFGGGVGAVVARIGASAKTLSGFTSKNGKGFSMAPILALAAVIFLIALVLALSSLIPHAYDLLGRLLGWQSHPVRVGPVAIAICVAFVTLVAFIVNVNRFSAHALYRNRLIRAFLGSARGPTGAFGKTGDPFTGFDREDNVWMRDMMFPDQSGQTRLFPVINMALNTVAGANNAWRERKAESFTVTPLRSGNEWVGFWPTTNYGSRKDGLSLGTAIAISGAAASPNMGYHSSPLVGLIMTLFNVRLGWWLGNPSQPYTAAHESPPFGMIQFISELFGLTNDKSAYVYLSDGGHFENLGLYEMVRRRCSFILVSDAGCDPDYAFADLGNAVRKIWIDLGIKIDFGKIAIEKRPEPGKTSQGVYCAAATITYPEGGQGHLLYLKPTLLGSEPADVRAYASAYPDFPNQTTADQFFTESQMESYRSLGAHIVETVFGDADDDDSDSPIDALAPYWRSIKKFA